MFLLAFSVTDNGKGRRLEAQGKSQTIYQRDGKDEKKFLGIVS
jgi:hypothetical protein